ncbi:hypothetical protein PR048_012165 [Dryococelus australis]|uniref:Uncharacterized protein n=1 Tax=Dryococelus australis TaxID=614101 RepID=A0ABQ9HNK7_9NEOP|nr:hypothetical protein PR048_012165 [Dryococelus australis]
MMASVEHRRNARTEEIEDPRENPPTSGIVPHDSHMRISGGDIAGSRLKRGFESRWGCSEVCMDQRRNEGAGETGDARENPPTSGIVQHDSRLRKSGVNRPGTKPGSPRHRGPRGKWLGASLHFRMTLGVCIGTVHLVGCSFDKMNFKSVYTEVTFAIGSEFVRHALDDSAPIADLQRNKKRISRTVKCGVTLGQQPIFFNGRIGLDGATRRDFGRLPNSYGDMSCKGGGTSALLYAFSSPQSWRPFVHTLFDTSWRILGKSSPSTVTPDNQCAVNIGIFVHKTIESSLQVIELGNIFRGTQIALQAFLSSCVPNHFALRFRYAITWFQQLRILVACLRITEVQYLSDLILIGPVHHTVFRRKYAANNRNKTAGVQIGY